MLKKMMLLAMAVGALVAFSAPAVASAADQWTANGEPIAEGNEAVEKYEGSLTFTTPSPPFPLHGTFTCPVTIEISVVGTEDGTGDGEVTSFFPTTTSCAGTGLFVNCHLINDTSNPPWQINIGATPITIVGPININNQYTSCTFGQTSSSLSFNSVSGTPTDIGGSPTSQGESIHSIDINGTATNGAIASGSVTAEDIGILSIDD